jgi:protein-tyrosine phosphatase
MFAWDGTSDSHQVVSVGEPGRCSALWNPSVRAGVGRGGDVRSGLPALVGGRWPSVSGDQVSWSSRYNPHVHFLFVCTANICRSPMAAALFAAQTQDLTDSVQVSSAGLLTARNSGPTEVPDEVLEVMAPYGIDLDGHQSRGLTVSMLVSADLVIGMGRRHVQEAILLDPPCWPKAFMLKELVRRGGQIGPRRPDQGIRSWIDEVHGDRTRASLAHRSSVDEVVDPYGGTLVQYRSTAAELAQLTAQLHGLLWPGEPHAPTS